MSKPKWGSVDEIDRRTKVGSDAWKARHSESIQHLSAFRHLHDIAPHEDVRHLADASVQEKLKAIEEIKNGKG
jgi:hypothetical protein